MRRLLVVACAGLAAIAACAGTSPTREAAASTDGSTAFTTTQTVSRTSESGGQTTVVENRAVTLSVSDTADLQGRQEIAVNWSGAHPTGGIVANPNSAAAEKEEYPVVLLECRGTNTPGANQITPSTCWTQNWGSRYQDSATNNRDGNWPAYRLDQYSSPPGAALVNAPATVPDACQTVERAPVQYWVPWDAADGTVYSGGLGGACGEPPEATDVGGSALPSNEVYGVTGNDTKGQTDFDVLDASENATLGCSQTVACALVAVPIMGISCDADLLGASPTQADLASLADCEGKGYYQPGTLQPSQYNDLNEPTVSGELWWAPSNWRNRITVPLTFAPPPDVCSIVGSSNAVDIAGSELMLQATGQWAPHFCLEGKGADHFSLIHVAEGEPQARNQVALGSATGALTSYAPPDGYGKPVVNALFAVTGFTISYSIDGSDGDPITTLHLTPLLLAKLLTQSYPGLTAGQGGDPTLAGNPLDIARDPEFVALNPGISQSVPNAIAASELVSLSSSSDVIEALTTYINDDPAARAFLNGTPDKSMPGEDMVVNPEYKGLALPVNQWPLRSKYISTSFDTNPSNSPCLQDNPQPLGALIAAPLGTMNDISLDMQFSKANSTTTCSSTGADGTVNSMVANGIETPGFRFMIGLTSLADDSRYGIRAAELETAEGKFVGPDDASLKAAAALSKFDSSTGTWPIPYEEFRTPTGSSAYPGTMVVYAAVPTKGLLSTAASDYASLLRFTAGAGQSPGSGVGQLPAGYLPITKANGLAAWAAYTEAAAADVAAQKGELPSTTATKSPTDSTPQKTPTTSSTSTPPTETVSTSSTPYYPSTESDNAETTSSPIPSAGSTSDPSSSAGGTERQSAPPVRFISIAATSTPSLWTGGLPIALIVGLALLGVLVVPGIYLLGRRSGRW